jgi:hypothetical protein
MPYHLAILHTALFWTLERGEGEGRSRARRTSRAVQERGDIASKQQGSPFKTDYNKLATLIETNGKLSALFASNAIPIKVGERFCNQQSNYCALLTRNGFLKLNPLLV